MMGQSFTADAELSTTATQTTAMKRSTLIAQAKLRFFPDCVFDVRRQSKLFRSLYCKTEVISTASKMADKATSSSASATPSKTAGGAKNKAEKEEKPKTTIELLEEVCRACVL